MQLFRHGTTVLNAIYIVNYLRMMRKDTQRPEKGEKLVEQEGLMTCSPCHPYETPRLRGFVALPNPAPFAEPCLQGKYAFSWTMT